MTVPSFLDEWLEPFRQPWKPISTGPVVAWLIFYALFLIYAFRDQSGYLFIDNVNLVIHEGGHPLFGWFGATLGVWGGTLLELIVPASLAIYFARERQLFGAAFCTFFFFENFLYIGTYMADARAQDLPLVTVGDPEFAEHDWFRIFSDLGVLQHDTQIGAATRLFGWLGMLATAGWLVWRWRQSRSQELGARAAAV